METSHPANLDLPARNFKGFTYEHALLDRQPLQVMKVGHLCQGATVKDDKHFVEGTSPMPSASELETIGADNGHLALWVGMLPKSCGTGTESVPFCPSALPVVIKLGNETVHCYALIPGQDGFPRNGVKIKFEKVFFFPEYCTLDSASTKARKVTWKKDVEKLKLQARQSFDISPQQDANATTQSAGPVAGEPPIMSPEATTFLRLESLISEWLATGQPVLQKQIEVELTKIGHITAYDKLFQLALHELFKSSSPNLLVEASTAIAQHGVGLNQYELSAFLGLFYREYQRKDSADHADLDDGDAKLAKLGSMAEKIMTSVHGALLPGFYADGRGKPWR